jgi:O-antigen ligase
MLGCLAWYGFIMLQKQLNRRLTIVIIVVAATVVSSLVLFTQNPISRRFNDILHGNIDMVEQSSFNKGTYFNGVQFRLLQWRFVKEIIQENNAWLWGVSPADAQAFLNRKYVATNMYTGGPGSASHGFLGYNTHNQFLEAFLQTGIIGLIFFLFICFEMVRMAVQQKSRMLWALVTLLIAYSFSEAVLETQYGLVIFIFFPLLFAQSIGKQSTANSTILSE